MSDECQEMELRAALQARFRLSPERQDQLWQRFQARARMEAQAWAFLTVAMVRTQARLRPAALRWSWAARRR